MRCGTKDRNTFYPSFITSTPLPRLRSRLGDQTPNLSPIIEEYSHRKKRLSKEKCKQESKLAKLFTKGGSTINIKEKQRIGTQVNKDDQCLSKAPILNKIKTEPDEMSNDNLPSFCIMTKSEDSIDALVKEEIDENMKPSINTAVFNYNAVVDQNTKHLARSVMKQESASYLEQVEEIQGNETKSLKRKALGKVVKRKNSLKAKTNKENLVRKIISGEHEVDLILVKANKKLENKSQVLKTNIPKTTPLSKTAVDDPEKKLAHESLPVITKLQDVAANDWQQVEDQEGIFIRNNFLQDNINFFYLKFEAKCKLSEVSTVKNMIFVVSEGLGTVTIKNKVENVSTGDTINIPSGCKYEILNRGLKKRLIVTCIKFL